MLRNLLGTHIRKCVSKVQGQQEWCLIVSAQPRNSSSSSKDGKGLKKASTPIGRLDDKWEGKNEEMKPQKKDTEESKNAYAPFSDGTNPETGEIGGPVGPEPTRYGDWERKGRVIDF